MLNGIPAVLPPDLVKAMMEMGHGDTLVIGDAHFPAASMGQRVVQCCGIPADVLLDAILKLMPLDEYVEEPVGLMQIVPGDDAFLDPPIWKKYQAILDARAPKAKIRFIERFQYYEEAKKAYVVIQSGELAQYANVLLKKGIVKI